MFASVPTASLLGASGQRISVEVHVGTGIPSFTIVGLPDEACRESRDRVRAALISAGVSWPQKRITVNLAPSGVRKSGTALDLPLAIGILVAAGTVHTEAVRGMAFLGELGLDGTLRPVPGTVPMVAALGEVCAVVPARSHHEAELAVSGTVRSADHLRDLLDALAGNASWPDPPRHPVVEPGPAPPDLADVRGQPAARRALEVAAAGGHHLLMIGPPGAGKTMLARRLPGLLVPLGIADALEVTMIHSAAGLPLPPGGLVRHPPFRAPHHSATLVSMVGGGTTLLRPGEVSLAHRGCLFLDELGEFSPAVIDGLRQPLEDRVVRISRARASTTMPADVLLVAATNPCPCGGGGPGACSCTEAGKARYLRRLSGPLLDRFDLRVAVDRPPAGSLLDPRPAESTATVLARVEAARRRALERAGMPNGRLEAPLLEEIAPLHRAARSLLASQLERGRLTARGLLRVRRVARTLADLEGLGDVLEDEVVALALQLRVPWGSAAEVAA